MSTWDNIIPLEMIVNTLADAIAGELEMRNIKFSVDREWNLPGTSLVPKIKVTPVGIMTKFNADERNLPFQEYKEKFIKPWALEFGVKLARPFELTIYPLEVPQTVYEKAISLDMPGVVRGLSDYHIESDSILTRFDMLVSWKE